MTDITDLIERDPVAHALAARLCIEELRREVARLTTEVGRLTMRLLVTGPRNLKDYWLVYEILDSIHAITPITVLIEGGAPGTDRFARRWANDRGVATDPCPVDHVLDGPWPAAGPRRNARMLKEKKPDRGLAFIADPPTPGTSDMVRRMKRVGLEVREVCGVEVER